MTVLTHRINTGISSSDRPRIIGGWLTLSVSMFSTIRHDQLLFNNRTLSS